MSIARQFGAITKVEDQPDGTIKVWGVASCETRDSVGELITADAMKGALPDYERFPALREMHQPSAAGRVIEADVDSTGATQICAHVVDPIAITKVRAGVYAGFSVGGKVLKRDPTDRTIITVLKLTEISLVDAPCNPDAVISMWKADMTQYTPSGDEVVAKARELATEAGSKKYKDFLFKARETLIAESLQELGDDEEGEDVAKVDEPENADVVADAPEAATEGAEVETDEAKLAAALLTAIEKAGAAIPEPVAAEAEVAGPFADMAKAGAAMVLIAKTVQGDDLTKGLWMVGNAARILECVGELASSLAWEARDEGDIASPLPGMGVDILNRVKAWIIAIANEETAELLAQITTNLPDFTLSMIDGPDCSGDVIILANEIVDLVKADTDLMAKAGARNSKTDAAMIQTSHDHMAKLGATCDKANCGDDGDAEKVAMTAENERLTKALETGTSAVDDLTKRFGDTVTALNATVADLTKRLEQVESEPAAPKTAAGPLRAISKAEDISPNAGGGDAQIAPDDFQKALDSLSEDARGQLLLRVALSNPQLVKSARTAA